MRLPIVDACSLQRYFLLEDRSKNLRLVASAGKQNHLFKELRLPFDPDVSGGDGFHGPALRTGKPVISLDPKSDSRSGPWMDLIVRGGVTSLGYFPLFRQGRAVGVFFFCCRNTDEFQQDQASLDLMARMAQNITFGIDMFAEQTQKGASFANARSPQRYERGDLASSVSGGTVSAGVRSVGQGRPIQFDHHLCRGPHRSYLRAMVSPGPFGDYIRNLQIPLTGDLPEARVLYRRLFEPANIAL